MRLSLLGNIIDLFFPRYCAICDERLLGTEEMLCATCLSGPPDYPNLGNRPMTTIWLKSSGGGFLSKDAALSSITSATPHPSYIIYQLKYMHHPETGIYLGRHRWQRGFGIQILQGIDAIIPIPLTRKREGRPAAIIRAR